MYSIQVSNSRCSVIVFTHWLDQKDRNNVANCKKKYPCLQGIYSQAVLFQKLESRPRFTKTKRKRSKGGIMGSFCKIKFLVSESKVYVL
jgi:hypothetical protein